MGKYISKARIKDMIKNSNRSVPNKSVFGITESKMNNAEWDRIKGDKKSILKNLSRLSASPLSESAMRSLVFNCDKYLLNEMTDMELKSIINNNSSALYRQLSECADERLYFNRVKSNYDKITKSIDVDDILRTSKNYNVTLEDTIEDLCEQVVGKYSEKMTNKMLFSVCLETVLYSCLKNNIDIEPSSLLQETSWYFSNNTNITDDELKTIVERVNMYDAEDKSYYLSLFSEAKTNDHGNGLTSKAKDKIQTIIDKFKTKANKTKQDLDSFTTKIYAQKLDDILTDSPNVLAVLVSFTTTSGAIIIHPALGAIVGLTNFIIKNNADRKVCTRYLSTLKAQKTKAEKKLDKLKKEEDIKAQKEVIDKLNNSIFTVETYIDNLKPDTEKYGMDESTILEQLSMNELMALVLFQESEMIKETSLNEDVKAYDNDIIEDLKQKFKFDFNDPASIAKLPFTALVTIFKALVGISVTVLQSYEFLFLIALYVDIILMELLKRATGAQQYKIFATDYFKFMDKMNRLMMSASFSREEREKLNKRVNKLKSHQQQILAITNEAVYENYYILEKAGDPGIQIKDIEKRFSIKLSDKEKLKKLPADIASKLLDELLTIPLSLLAVSGVVLAVLGAIIICIGIIAFVPLYMHKLAVVIRNAENRLNEAELHSKFKDDKEYIKSIGKHRKELNKLKDKSADIIEEDTLIYVLEGMNILNTIKLAGQTLVTKAKKLGVKEKQLADNMDSRLNEFVRKVEIATSTKKREQVIKGQVLPSFSNIFKMALASGVSFLINPLFGLITTIGTIAVSKNATRKERMYILDELDIQLRVVEKKIQQAEMRSDTKQLEDLYRLETRLKKEHQRIKYNMKSYGDPSINYSNSHRK